MVLGDIGRSPRMQYHALSLLEEGHYVTLIGYAGESLVPPLEMASTRFSDDGASSRMSSSSSKEPPPYHGHLHVLRMAPYQLPKTVPLYRLLYYPLRLLTLSCCVIYTLWIRLNGVPHTKMPPDVILVQNPPSAPTLLLACAYRAWRGTWGGHRPRLVIDWHNLGYTMFEHPDSTTDTRGRYLAKKTIRKLAEWYERTMATRADAHLTVTRAMENWLGENFNVHGRHVRVLYDRPPSMFRPTGVEEQHELFSRLKLKCDLLEDTPADDMQRREQIIDETMFTQSIREGGGNTTYRLRKDRPALIVSSTSWTPDEDFSILLTALRELHKKIETIADDGTFPKVLVIVTGKGPQKAHYLPLLKEFNETHIYVNMQTLWLEADDYPKLLGCATLGISLHTSTSGLDLPMKVSSSYTKSFVHC
jgi:beta-1,4-mannosyltransferase